MKKVLIVDDSKLSRVLIKNTILEAQPDTEIREAETGDDGLAMLSDYQPDLITLDINMPGTHGLMCAVKMAQKQPGARIVIITANIQQSLRKEMQACGVLFAGLIEKPINEAARQQLVRLLQ